MQLQFAHDLLYQCSGILGTDRELLLQTMGAVETSMVLQQDQQQQRTFLSTLYFTFSALRDTTFKSSSQPTYLPVATTLFTCGTGTGTVLSASAWSMLLLYAASSVAWTHQHHGDVRLYIGDGCALVLALPTLSMAIARYTCHDLPGPQLLCLVRSRESLLCR